MTEAGPPERRVIGVMTGTSIDGLDAALVGIAGRGLDINARLIDRVGTDLGTLAGDLRRAADQEAMPAGDLARLAWDFGELHAKTVDRLLEDGLGVDLVVAHGQTVYHQPPVSWQLINPAPVAAVVDCPVICDLRQDDLTRGGQGAPITPLADWILFGRSPRRRAVVNLGGYCNVTILPAGTGSESIDGIRGFDVCACNHVLDAVARHGLGAAYDEGGAAAGRGRVAAVAADDLRVRLQSQRASRRSLGTGDETLHWVAERSSSIPADDLAATAVSAVATVVAEAVGEYEPDEIILAGGGTANRALVTAIGACSARPTCLSDVHGVPAGSREAMAMAILGALRVDGIPITLPRVTGRGGSGKLRPKPLVPG